jgi:hypothetical protein
MPSPDNTSIAPAFAVEDPIGSLTQSITFGPPPSVEYGNVGIPSVGAIAVTLAVGDELVVYDGGAGHTEANKDDEDVTNVDALDNTYVNTGANPTAGGTTSMQIDYEQIGESIVKATVARVPDPNTYNAGDQVLVSNGTAGPLARLMIPSDFD